MKTRDSKLECHVACSLALLLIEYKKEYILPLDVRKPYETALLYVRLTN
jgi:hypothetical protein